ncbi:type II secretion system F family protein [Georgenia thermotolerans]|uniref:Type II secretion system protein F n=1 Tax=Georgenia thermotolerans TaxID=527326 RepID=A0A7J5UM51_9MICO|nr:type II secretion system F family protein [Georgenia thermotolerans]KAE8763448.1 type II secretion system protein F [Georgenia thermotolerans]
MIQLQLGLGALVLGLGVAVYLLLGPRPARLPLDRRRLGAAPSPGLLAGAAALTTEAAAKALQRRRAGAGVAALERAGIKSRPQDLLVLLVVGMVVAGAVGAVLAGPLLGLVLAALVPVGARVRVGMLIGKRQAAFADQLDDSLQLMASSLRAGHSLPQALASVARESEQPTSEELARVINETRVGRELGEALAETAARMGSEDFDWVTQAIAINREVGGNLAEVLDGVGRTIRERNQIRRQVKALSAEGKLSAIVLMALPFGIVAFLLVANPAYLAKFTQSLLGYGLMGLAVVLLVVGGVWLSKTVKIKF